ncbi:MAG: acyl-CoA/acyl-ACP dehydrogenase [Planctomycetota bacterium]|nr:acyl-CoA/acyl-ACP dehydrogenase [Planctomycetota bacterium]
MSLSIPRDQALAFRNGRSARQQNFDAVWPTPSWDDLCSAGITRWTIPVEFGGDDQPPVDLIEGCLELARCELLVTFILSQFQGACQRITASTSMSLKERWLPGLAAGTAFATVGISHLTTSRQHTAVAATPEGENYRLTGEIPWVTGGRQADVLVVGGTLTDGRQILAAVPVDRTGVEIGEPMSLLALTGSETGSVKLHQVEVLPDERIAGPVTGVIQHIGSGGAGSLMTSTLALGHAFGCLDHLQQEAAARSWLEPMIHSLSAEADGLRSDLLAAAKLKAANPPPPEQLRAHATDLALRCSQTLLTSTKGAGFVAGHPAERLAREALFFLVWSCPQSVTTKLLNNFSGTDHC